MVLPKTPRAWFDALSWHARGLYATEAIRRIGFRARELWQPAEIEARKGIGRDLASDVEAELRIDRALGHLVMPAHAIPAVDEVCAIGQRIIQQASVADGELIGAKKFFRIRIATRDERLALLRIGLDRRVLAMACAHLGVLPVITEADYFCSFPVAGPYTKSQLWHCDDDSSDVFKVFVYCTDVTPDDGPFQMIEPRVSHRVRAAIGYRYGGRRYRVSDNKMDAHTGPDDIRSIIGPRGTAFAVDTVRSFHRGSRIHDPQRRRVMATICYTPPSAASLPRRLAARPAPLVDEFAPDLADPLERAVLGLPVATKWI